MPDHARPAGRAVTTRPRRRALRVLLAAVAVTGLGGTAVAGAAATTTVACRPDDTTACLNLTVTVSDVGPAAGVRVQVEGAGPAVEAVTDATGRVSIGLTEPGPATVDVDEATLPAGTMLRDPDAYPAQVEVRLGRSLGRVVQLLPPGASPDPAVQSPAAQSPAASATDDPRPSPTAGADTGTAQPPSAGTNRVTQLVLAGTVFGVLLALASLGANLVYGTTRLSNFAHGELVTLGGMTAFVAVQQFGMPLWLAVVTSTAVGAAAGWVLNRMLLAPLRRRGVGVTQQMIVTIGLSLAMVSAFLFAFGARPAPIVTDISPRLRLGPVAVSGQSLVSVAVALAVLGAAAWVLSRTRVGRATRAVSDNPALAAATGIKVESVIAGVWVASAALASLGGVLLSLYLGTTRFNLGSTLLLLMFAAITLGGLGSALGAVVGAVVIGLVVELSTLVLPNDLRYASALVVLVLVLLLRPQGILGRAQRVG